MHSSCHFSLVLLWSHIDGSLVRVLLLPEDLAQLLGLRGDHEAVAAAVQLEAQLEWNCNNFNCFDGFRKLHVTKKITGFPETKVIISIRKF